MNSNPFFQSLLPSFMLGGQITVFYYFASLLCILFISVVLPSFWRFFQKLHFFLPAICVLGKTTDRYTVPLPTVRKISAPCSCHTASFINVELNPGIPRTVLIYMFSRYVCHFPKSDILLLGKWLLTVGPTNQPSTE